MPHRILLAMFGLAALATAQVAQALAPPSHGPFPAAVLRAAQAGLFTPSRDPGGAPLRAQAAPRPESGHGSSATAFMRVPMVPVDFSDQASRFSRETLDSLVFEPRAEGPGTGSAHDYYWDISLHQLDLSGDVLPWVHLTHEKNYYAGGHSGLNYADPYGHNAAAMVVEALQSIDSLTDFSPYDADGDGYVDAVCFLHSGLGGEADVTDPTNLWSHAASLTRWGFLPYRTRTPWPGHPGEYLKVNKYTVIPEVSGQHAGALNEIGSFCHEFGHMLGLPDLYDIYSPTYAGVGNWDLMAGGVYGGDGRHAGTPAQMGAWCRASLGWVPSVRVSQEGPVKLNPTETDPSTLQLWSDGRPQSEYYLLEDRAPLGWDRYLPTAGLLVWHIDDDLISSRLYQNAVERSPYFGVRLLEADNLDQLFQGVNRGDAGDPYPGSTHNADLDDNTSPAALDNTGADPHVSIRGIRLNPDLTVQAFLSFTPDRWLAPHDVPGAAGSVHLSAGAGQSVAADPQGALHLVWSGDQGGNPHIFHLAKRLGILWAGAPDQVDQAGVAFSPALACNARGDVMVVWEQLFAGHTQLAARRRPAGGDWDPVWVLSDGPNLSSPPCLVSDSKNVFYCAWAERQDGNGVEQLRTLSFHGLSGWDGHAATLMEDSSASNPVLTVDNTDRVHLVYQRHADGRYRLYHVLHPSVSGFWTQPEGPLSAPITQQTPILAALDSARVFLAWRIPASSGESVFLRRYQDNRWGPPEGPVLEGIQSTWPITMLADPSFSRIFVMWEADEGNLAQVRYREVGVLTASDAGPHNLAGSDSVGASQPVAVWDSNRNLVAFWLENGALRSRTRQASAPMGKPPQILPPASSPSHLGPNWPNPVAPRTRIPFEVPAAAATRPDPGVSGAPAPPSPPRQVRLTLHDVSGRIVRVLAVGPREPGRYEVEWDGILADGRRAPSGVYFYRLDLGMGLVETRKLLLLR